MEAKKRKFIKELSEKPRLRRESGLYIVDGPKMCGEIPGELIEELYVSENFLKRSEETGSSLPAFLTRRRYELISESEMKKLSDTVTPQGVLAVVRQKRQRDIRELSDSVRREGRKGLFIGLQCVQDPGNVGTIIRSAEAAGADALICDRGCADIYSPKVVRSTMGSIFRLPVLSAESLSDEAEILKKEGYEVFAACLAGSEDYTLCDLVGDSFVLIGNESRGLTESLIDKATKRIRIPMLGKAESLNAAVAASVIMFEAARKRRNDLRKRL